MWAGLGQCHVADVATPGRYHRVGGTRGTPFRDAVIHRPIRVESAWVGVYVYVQVHGAYSRSPDAQNR